MIESRVARKIDVQRGHRYKTVADRVKVSARAGVGFRPRRAHPVDGCTGWIHRPYHRFRLMPMPQTRGLEASDLRYRQIGYIDVEDGIRRQWVVSQLFQ